MKKFIGIAGLGLLFMATACDTKDGYSEYTSSTVAPAISIITNLNDNSVVVSEGYYVFNSTQSTQTGNTASVSSPTLISNNVSLGFNTETQDYASTGNDIFLANAKGTAGSTGLELKNANFLATYAIGFGTNYGYYYDTAEIGDYTYSLPFKASNRYITVASFNIGDTYKVSTFQPNTFFKGTTKTEYPNAPEGGYINDEILYRFILNKDENQNYTTADMVLYNARFAEAMPFPLEAMVVKGLDVNFSADGVSITGDNIKPEWYTNGVYVPMDRYIFYNLDFHTTNDANTECELTYQVGADYFGSFTGTYLNTYYKP